MIFVAIGICKKWEKKEKEERKEAQTKQRTKNEKPMRSSILHASAILFSSVLVHLCVVNSTVNEWSDTLVVCATSCEVTQTGKFCKHTGMLCKHFFAWVRAKSRGFAPVSCVYCKPAFRLCGDRFVCRLLTPLSAPARQCWHCEHFAFGMLLKVRWRRRRRFDKGVEIPIADLLPKTFVSFSPEGRSSEIGKYAAAVRTDCEKLKIARVQSTMYRPEGSLSAETKKSTQLCVHTHAYLAIKASISARNAANSCCDLLE